MTDAIDKNAVARTFNITNEEQESITNWLEEHRQRCPILSDPSTADWLSSPIHHIFTPCTICISIRIKCNCGAEFNVPSELDQLF